MQPAVFDPFGPSDDSWATPAPQQQQQQHFQPVVQQQQRQAAPAKQAGVFDPFAAVDPIGARPVPQQQASVFRPAGSTAQPTPTQTTLNIFGDVGAAGPAAFQQAPMSRGAGAAASATGPYDILTSGAQPRPQQQK